MSFSSTPPSGVDPLSVQLGVLLQALKHKVGMCNGTCRSGCVRACIAKIKVAMEELKIPFARVSDIDVRRLSLFLSTERPRDEIYGDGDATWFDPLSFGLTGKLTEGDDIDY